MGMLTVRRRGYTRKDGTWVEATTYKVKDRGKKGRTPKGKRWYEPKTEMGWEKKQPSAKRRRLALRAHGGDKLAAARALQALANVTTDKPTERLARADAKHFFKLHKRGE